MKLSKVELMLRDKAFLEHLAYHLSDDGTITGAAQSLGESTDTIRRVAVAAGLFSCEPKYPPYRRHTLLQPRKPKPEKFVDVSRLPVDKMRALGLGYPTKKVPCRIELDGEILSEHADFYDARAAIMTAPMGAVVIRNRDNAPLTQPVGTVGIGWAFPRR